MSQDKYFREELAFLKEQGSVFTQLHPQLTKFLNGRNTDPDVERLLEGFAFLTGKLREKVDDEFPELTHSVINMLWPNYLRPVPSLTICRFTPNEKAISVKQRIEQGVQIDSLAVLNTVCHFSTCRDVDLYPLERTDVSVHHTRDASQIDVNLAILGEQSTFDMHLDDLRFYLGGDNYSAQMLYLWLNHYLEQIEVVQDDQVYHIPATALGAVGFGRDDGILPYPKNVYEGYRVLQEYLTFPQAFLFCDVKDISDHIGVPLTGEFVLRFCFNKTIPTDVRIRKESFELYCTPAINLFSHDADPIDLNGKKAEYRVIPSSRYPAHYEVFSIDHVEGWAGTNTGRVRGQERVYTPFESFQHEIERSEHRHALYYRQRVKESIRNDGFDFYLSFVRGDEIECQDLSEAISLQLTCTNRQLPLELGIGDLCVQTDSSPSFASFTNITEPTQPLRPVLDGSLLWTLISNLSLNYLSLLSKDALCSILRAYDFRALVDRQAELIAQKRLQGIESIESKPIEKVLHGLPIRGLRSQIVLNQEAFGSEGELYLFGTILSQFFSLYASINSFHELIVINANNRERYSWGAQTGQQPLI